MKSNALVQALKSAVREVIKFFVKDYNPQLRNYKQNLKKIQNLQ